MLVLQLYKVNERYRITGPGVRDIYVAILLLLSNVDDRANATILLVAKRKISLIVMISV